MANVHEFIDLLKNSYFKLKTEINLEIHRYYEESRDDDELENTDHLVTDNIFGDHDSEVVNNINNNLLDYFVKNKNNLVENVINIVVNYGYTTPEDITWMDQDEIIDLEITDEMMQNIISNAVFRMEENTLHLTLKKVPMILWYFINAPNEDIKSSPSSYDIKKYFNKHGYKIPSALQYTLSNESYDFYYETPEYIKNSEFVYLKDEDKFYQVRYGDIHMIKNNGFLI
jgi:hypothetical protein